MAALFAVDGILIHGNVEAAAFRTACAVECIHRLLRLSRFTFKQFMHRIFPLRKILLSPHLQRDQ